MEQLVKWIKSLSLSNSTVRVTGLIVLLLFFKINFGQNLIQNPSFERTTNPNCLSNPFSHVDDWASISSPDYFSALCTNGGYRVPVNGFGVSYPVNGNAYVGIASYYKIAEVKEYIYQHLNNPLIAGNCYYVSFYISLADRTGYAIKNIGANFTVAQPSVAVSNTYIPSNPQVENQIGFLNDTAGWTKIEGYFKAEGGEQYITIGNFNSNAYTDTLYIGTNDPLPSDAGMTYYYIDSVSLYDSLDYVTNVRKIENEIKFSVYPNPVTEILNVKCKMLNDKSDLQIRLSDVVGREILLTEFKSQFDIYFLEKGIYFISILKNNRTLVTQKIVKE